MTGADYKNEDIQQKREALGMTQGQLAEAVSVHLVTISRVENGHVCSFELLRSIAGVLQMDWRDLLRPEPPQVEKKYIPSITFAVDSL